MAPEGGSGVTPVTALPVPGVAAARRRATGRRLPRLLHPVAWWVWAFGMAGAAIETTDPVLLVLLGTVVTFVVALRRSSAPWARSFTVYLRLAVIVVTLQVVFEILFGQRIPGRVLFSFPHVPLPGWAQGVSVGGPVTAEGLAGAAVRGVRVAVVLLCFGAANTLASPYRLLRSLPTVLYEAGGGVTVALAFAPEVINALAATRRARRLLTPVTKALAFLL